MDSRVLKGSLHTHAIHMSSDCHSLEVEATGESTVDTQDVVHEQQSTTHCSQQAQLQTEGGVVAVRWGEHRVRSCYAVGSTE